MNRDGLPDAVRADGEESELGTRVAELQQELRRLRERVAALEASVGDRDHRLAALARQAAEREAELFTICSGRSWRLTAPLRRAAAGGRAVRMRRVMHMTDGADRVAIPLASLEWSEVTTPAPGPRPVRWAEGLRIEGRECVSLEQHLPARVSYRVAVPAGSAFSAYAAVHPQMWQFPTGPARFSVGLIADGRRIAGRELLLDPHRVHRHRAWVRVTLELETAVEGELVLETSAAEPGDAPVVVAWGDPALLVPADPIQPSVTASPNGRSSNGALASEPRGGNPHISILMPVHDPPPEFLERAVQTVRAQTYSHWQLCIADDGSCDARVHAVLDEILAGGDERIVVARRPHGGISAASNAALDLATGDYVALLDHDDEIEPDALAAIAEHLRAHPDTDVVYTDEDRVLADGTRFGQVLKPDWSPELLGGGMYACHLIVYRRELIERAGRFRGDYDGSQDFDLLLRIADHTDRVGHVPRVLYHWRAHSASVAIDHRSKPYAFDAAERALREHLRRRGIDGAVQRTALPGLYRTVHRRTPGETASIIVGWDPRAAGAAAPAALRRAVAQLARGTDGTCELICAVPDDQATACAQALAGAGEGRMRLVKAGKDPAPGDLLERGARAATGEHLVLLAAPCAPAGAGWLGELLGFSRRDGIGAVGAKVLDREGRVAHGGIVLPDGVPLAAYRGVPADSMGNIGTLVVACNYSAVDGVVATRSELFARLGGLREADADLALIDYCIRAGAEGRRTVFAPAAMLVLADAAPRPPIPLAALARLQQRFRARHRRDPYYNPAFSSLRAELPTPPVPPAAVGA